MRPTKVNFAISIKRFVEKGLARIAPADKGCAPGTHDCGAPCANPPGEEDFFMTRIRFALAGALLLASAAPATAQGSAAPAAAPRPSAASRFMPFGIDLAA